MSSQIPPGTVELLPGTLKPESFYELKVPASVEIIAPKALADVKMNKISFTADSRLRELGCEACRGLPLYDFTAPASLRVIGQGAFAECKSMREVRLNEGLETIGKDEYGPHKKPLEGAFQHTWVERAFLPSTLRRIEYAAFRGCPVLRTIALPSGLRFIGARTFSESGLQTLEIPRTVQKIGERAFAGCRQLRELFVDVGSVLQGLGEGAFEDTALKTAHLPEDLGVEIGAKALRGAKIVRLPSGKLKIGPKSLVEWREARFVRLPDDISAIGDYWFTRARVEELHVPASVSKIGVCAFLGCTGLRSVTVEVGSALSEIEEGAFSECQALKRAYLPADMNSGVREQFKRFSTVVDLPGSGAMIGGIPLSECRQRSEFEIPDGVEEVPAGAFAGSALYKVVIPGSVSAICESAFNGCARLVSVKLAEGLRVLGSSCFEAAGVKEVVLPCSVREIGRGAFRNCKGLRSIVLPGGLKIISEEAFKGSGLVRVSVPGSVESIGDRAFQSC